MIRARFWATLALAQPSLLALLWSFTSVRIRLATWCQVGLARLSSQAFEVVLWSCVGLGVCIALTFIGHALGNARISWGMRAWWATAILLFSPVLVPAYWAIHLRRS